MRRRLGDSNAINGDASILNFNRFTLNFSDQNIEAKFRSEYFEKSLNSFRISFVTVILLYSAFGYLDFTTSGNYYKEFFIIRYSVVFPLLLGVFLFSYHNCFKYAWQTLLSICLVTGGVGIIYMLLRNPENIYYYGGMFLIFMAGYFFIKLRFLAALISGIILIIAYNIGAFFFRSMYHIEYDYLLITNTFYISANIIAMIALYNIEYLERIDFNRRLALSDKQKEITLINQNLENLVEKRTKLLNRRNKKLSEEIKHRQKIENNLIVAKEKAEESDRLKSAFLANMSHEIRTPMNGILGFAELLKKPLLSGEEQQSYIEIIEKSGARMLNIINDLIDISKVESGQMEISISETNINQQVEYIYTFFKSECDQKGILLYFKNELPDNEAIINIDREKIYAILTNLVKNAIKFSEKGVIKMGYRLKNKYLEFYVIDNGIGIATEKLGNIFDRFVQADNKLSGDYDGSGLGLTISKAYVELLGGKIWVQSKIGIGSEFYFTIPYHVTAEKKSISKKE